jgi:hypothetical protein
MTDLKFKNGKYSYMRLLTKGNYGDVYLVKDNESGIE